MYDPDFTTRLLPEITAIPREMRELPRWVCWGSRHADPEYASSRKLDKKPIRPYGSWASSTDPGTWSTYEACAKACIDYPGRHWGIGFVFCADDDIHGIDLDHCRDPETGKIYSWAQRIMACLPTYWEISPSRTGVKGFLRGKPPVTGRSHAYGRDIYGSGFEPMGHVEVYESGRYFTVTGAALTGIRELRECPSGWEDVRRLVWGGDGDRIEAAKEAIALMDDSISEQGGHPKMFAMVCEAVRRIENQADLWDVIYWINENKCSPPWSQKELEHKVADALKQKATPDDFETVKLDDVLDLESPEPKSKAKKKKKGKLRLVNAATLPLEHIEWLWKGRIASVGLTMLDGDPGLGKSTLTADIVARITRSLPMPGETIPRKPMKVLYLTTEDDAKTTLLPRLEAAGADRNMVELIDKGPDNLLQLPSMAEELADVIEEYGFGFTVLDPLAGFLDPDVDLNSEASARGVLGSLCAVLERLRTACLALRHLSKNQNAKGLYRGLGSIAVTAQARSVIGVAPEKEDPKDTRVLFPVKLNIGKAPELLAYRVDDLPEPLWDTAGIRELEVGRICWLGDGEWEPLDDGEGQRGSKRPTPRLDEAIDVLKGELAAGPAFASDVMQDMQGVHGFSQETIKKAKRELGVLRACFGTNDKTLLYLPGQEEQLPSKETIDATLKDKSLEASATDEILAMLEAGPMLKAAVLEGVCRKTGCSASTFHRAFAKAGAQTVVDPQAKKTTACLAKDAPPPPAEGDEV